MKQLLLIAALCGGHIETYAQTVPEGTYAADSTARDSLMFKNSQAFSQQGENNEGTYYGQGIYEIRNDSLYLTYTRDIPGKTELILYKKGNKKAISPYSVTVYRYAADQKAPAVYGKYIMLELLDKDKKVLRLTELKGDGQYSITDSLLSETAYLRLAGDQDELTPGNNDYIFELAQAITKPTEIRLYTYHRLYNKVISNTVINLGKIALISDRQFVLSDGSREQTYTKK